MKRDEGIWRREGISQGERVKDKGRERERTEREEIMRQ